MLSCIDCRNLLLDHLYGLLNEQEAAGLRAHLADCSDCRAAQATAEAQQQLLAQAAQVYTQVPLFHAPVEETPAPAAPATLPQPARQRGSLRRWLGAAAAAAVVLLAVWGWREYDRGLRYHESDLAKQRKEAEGVQDRFVQLCKTYEAQRKELPGQVEKQFLQLQVLGPGNIQPGAANAYHVVTRDVHDRLRPARVIVKLLRQQDGEELGKWEYDSPGEIDVVVPAEALLAQTSQPILVLEARTPTASDKIRESLPLTRPVYVSQLLLNKTTFYPGERLFFRALTLERFSLRPPTVAAEEWQVDCRLLAADGKVLRRFDGTTTKGIVGGDFILDGSLSPGTYTLRLTATDQGGKRGFMPVQRQITILHQESPLIVFDRPQYGPNDKVNGQVFGRRLAGKALAGQKVTIEATVGGKPISVNGLPPGLPAPAQMDASGKAAFHMKMPPQVTTTTAAVVKARFEGGQDKKEEVEQTLKLVPTPVTVELFPEGGDLVPGVENRIYFRVQTAKDAPAQVEGKLIGPGGTELARFASKPGFGGGGGKLGLGSFQMTPPIAPPLAMNQASEKSKSDLKSDKNKDAQPVAGYKLVVSSEQGKTTTAVRLPVQHKGVALQVADAVCQEGQPLVVQLRDADPGRRLLVAVVCRGRLVAQQYVVDQKAGATVRLTPAPGTRGVLRLTVYDAEGKGLRPLAERLFFCKPAATLELNATWLNAPPKRPWKGGEQVELKIHANAKEAVVLAAVLDENLERAEAEPGIGNPLAHFFLATELEHPEDLEDAEVVLGEGPQAAQALDLFLGTQGWRRFVQPATTAELTLLTTDNGDRVQAASKQATNKQRLQLWEEVERERTALVEERQRRAAAAQDAAVALAAYQELPRQYGRLAAIVAIVGLFGLFVLGVAVVLLQTVRGLAIPRTLLGGVGLALVLSMFIYAVTGEVRLGGKAEEPQVAALLLRSPWRTEPEPVLTKVRPVPQGERDTVDTLALGGAQNRAKRDRGQPMTFSPTAKQTRERLQERSVLLVNSGGLGAAFKELKEDVRVQNIAPATAVKKSEKAADLGAEAKHKEGSPVMALRQYTYDRKGAATDLLLWRPALVLTDGSATVQFSLPLRAGAYRVLLYGNTPDGRLGFSQNRLETKE